MTPRFISFVMSMLILVYSSFTNATEARPQGLNPFERWQSRAVIIEVHDDAVVTHAQNFGEMVVCVDLKVKTITSCIAPHMEVYLGMFVRIYFQELNGPPARYIKYNYDREQRAYRLYFAQ